MIGSALLNLGRHEEAAKAFSEAYDFDPDWPGAMAIGATGALIEGHREEAYALPCPTYYRRLDSRVQNSHATVKLKEKGSGGEGCHVPGL